MVILQDYHQFHPSYCQKEDPLKSLRSMLQTQFKNLRLYDSNNVKILVLPWKSHLLLIQWGEVNQR